MFTVCVVVVGIINVLIVLRVILVVIISGDALGLSDLRRLFDFRFGKRVEEQPKIEVVVPEFVDAPLDAQVGFRSVVLAEKGEEAEVKNAESIPSTSGLVLTSSPSKVDGEVEKGEELAFVSTSMPQSIPSQANSSPSTTGRVSQLDALGKVFGGGKATNDENIHRLGVIDENLGMVTNTRDPIAQSLVGMLEQEALDAGYVSLAKTYHWAGQLLDVRLSSHKGWRAKQLEGIYSARHEEEVNDPELQEKFEGLGKRGKR